MNQEMPQLLASTYTSNTVTGDTFARGGFVGAGIAPKQDDFLLKQVIERQLAPVMAQKQQESKTMANATRIIKIFVADSDEAIPLDKRLLHSSEEKLTDLTDQELFFEVPIQELLSKHNEYRKTVTDKKSSEKFGRDVKLEPVRIRDLKMTVVTVASF